MALMYTEQPDGTLTALEDDVLVVLRPLSINSHAYEVWLGDEAPLHQGEASSLDGAKARVRAWLDEALAPDDD